MRVFMKRSVSLKLGLSNGENSIATTLAVEWGERIAIDFKIVLPDGGDDVVEKTNCLYPSLCLMRC